MASELPTSWLALLFNLTSPVSPHRALSAGSRWFSPAYNYSQRLLPSPINTIANASCLIYFPGGFLGSSAGKKCRRPGFNPWVRKTPWQRERLPLQHSGLENSIDYIVMGSQRVGHDWETFTLAYFYLILQVSVGMLPPQRSPPDASTWLSLPSLGTSLSYHTSGCNNLFKSQCP